MDMVRLAGVTRHRPNGGQGPNSTKGAFSMKYLRDHPADNRLHGTRFADLRR